jgi:hypothetical protein
MSEAPVFDETKKQYIPSANRTAIENITSQNRADGPCAGCRFELAPTALRIPSIADHHMISDSSPFANAFDELEFRVGSQSEQSPRLPSAGNSSQF